MTTRALRERLARCAREAGLTIPADVEAGLLAYYELLARWNAKINLTALPLREPTDATVNRLLVEPLAAARYVDDAAIQWFDLGSGGGSPAIPLKLARPHVALTMVESKVRKAAFLREAARTLSLAYTKVDNTRFEELANRPDAQGTAGLVTVRAVRTDAALFDAARRLLKKSGRLLLFTQSSAACQREGFEGADVVRLTKRPDRAPRLAIYRRVFHVEQSR